VFRLAAGLGLLSPQSLDIHARLPRTLLAWSAVQLEPFTKEHPEGPITAPLLQRIRTQITKRGFGKVAGRAIITFSGFAGDPREV